MAVKASSSGVLPWSLAVTRHVLWCGRVHRVPGEGRGGGWRNEPAFGTGGTPRWRGCGEDRTMTAPGRDDLRLQRSTKEERHHVL